MRTILTLGTIATALLGSTACTAPQAQPDSAAYLDALPNARILVSIPVAGERTVGELAGSYLTTVQVSADVNDFISEVLEAVQSVSEYEPTWSADENKFLWGPWNDGALDPNETALYVQYDEPANTYAWAVVQRTKGSVADEDWVAMIAGEALPGAIDDEGSGFFVVDFDAIAALNPADTVAGAFVSTYEVTANSVEAQALFEGFTDDTTQPERVTAAYVYGQDDAGAGHMDLVFLDDVHEDGSLEETVALRTRWQADGQGRGDMVIFDGDVAPLVYSGTECWGTNYAVVYEEENVELTSSGDAALCVFSDPEWNEEAPDL